MWSTSFLEMQSLHQPRAPSTISDEAFNIPSPERQRLLSELRKATGRDSVPAALWACLQVCDIIKLRQLVNDARSGVLLGYFDSLQDRCQSIPFHWIKRPLDWDLPSAWRTIPSPSSSSGVALERNKKRCFITKMPAVATPLYSQSMIAPYCTGVTDTSVAGFWKMLEFFFSEDRLRRWKMNLFGFRHLPNPGTVVDGCHNRICLEPFAYRLWVEGHFTLRLVSVSEDKKEIVVQFIWLPTSAHSRFDHVNISTLPGSALGLSSIWIGNAHADLTVRDGEIPTGARTARSGDTFVIRMDDPITHPLPSFELLDMHCCLSRIVLLSGTGDLLQNLYNFDYDDDNDDDYGSDDYS